MYTTYETVQYYWNDEYERIKRVKPPTIIPNDLSKPEFMPTKLVRISDMKVVDGSQVNEGYCALSYSWNQSGDILLDGITGKYERIDEGTHKIISYNGIFPEMVIPEYKTESNSKLDNIYQVFKIMDDHNYYFSTVQYVKFEGIIQRICQQFNIKYIWYDQLCINQDNKKEKQHEIRNMHHIYENAYCTVAFVPDYSHKNILSVYEQQYFKRLWTLEEAIKSKRLLFVGRNKHRWGEDCSYVNVANLTKSSSELNVSQILYHAHQRTTTKDHDRVFALIHLFPEFIEKINIDYDRKLEDLMTQFYGLLAKKDISILLFGKNGNYGSTVKKYKFLPSWTGVDGEHFSPDITNPFQNYDIIGKTMHVTTTYATNNQFIDDDNLTIREEDIPPIPDNANDDDNESKCLLCILVQLPETKEMKRIMLDYCDEYWGFCRNEISEKLQQLSRFMEIKKENLCWYNEKRSAKIIFDYLTDSLDDPSAQYVILSEISFKYNSSDCFCPVIKKKQGEEYYKAIGCCIIGSHEYFFLWL